jgi:hypothetical protein
MADDNPNDTTPNMDFSCIHGRKQGLTKEHPADIGAIQYRQVSNLQYRISLIEDIVIDFSEALEDTIPDNSLQRPRQHIRNIKEQEPTDLSIGPFIIRIRETEIIHHQHENEDIGS